MAVSYRLRALTRSGKSATTRHRTSVVAGALAGACVAALGLGRPADSLAATVTWDGGTSGAGSAWLTGTNWSPDLADPGPGVNDLGVFGTAGTVITIGINPNNTTNNGAANEAIGQIQLLSGINRIFNNSSTTVDGVLTLNGIGGVMLSNATTNGSLTIANGTTKNLGVVLGTSGEFNVANSPASITISSIVSETGGARTLTKTGAGTLTLSGANTFTGGVVVDNGSMNFASLNNLGTAQSLGSAGTVTIGGATNAATLTYTGAAATTDRNFAAGAAGGTLSHANNITYSGTISGTGPFTKAGAGTLQVTGTGFVSGLSINIAGGTVRLDNSATNSNDRLDDATSVNLSGGTLQFDGNRNVPTTETAGQLFVGSGGSTIRTTAVAGTNASNASIGFAGLSRGPGGTLAFDIATGVDVNIPTAPLTNGIIGGWAITGSDFATIDGGTGNVVSYASTVSNDPNLWGSSDNVKVTANGTLGGAGNVNSVQLADNAGAPVTLTLNGQLGVNSGGILATAVSGHTIDGTASLTSLGSELFVHVPNAAHVLNINVPIADNGGGNIDLITTGSGTTVLNAANTFHGTAQINGGTLQMGANGTLANNTVNVTGNGTFALNAQTKTIGALTGSGSVTLGAGGGVLSTGATNTSTTFSGVISGTGTLTKVGTGTMTLKGVNTFTGATNIGATDGVGAGGVLVVDADSRFGAAPGAATPGRINIYNGTLRLSGGTGQTGVVTSAGAAGVPGVLVAATRGITLNSGNGAIDVPTGQYAELPGIMADGAGGTSPLHKIGGGILDLRTAVNTFTGGVVIDGGTLGISADRNLGAVPGALNNAAVQLNNGATLKWYSSVGQAGLAANRGLTIGAGGGVIDFNFSSGTPNISHPITSGAGNSLTKLGPNTVQVNNSLPAMNGDLIVGQGRWNTQVSGAAGNGTIYLNAPDISPATSAGVAQLGIGGSNVQAQVALANNIVLNPTGQGATSFEVNISTGTNNNLTLNGNISGTGGLTKGRVTGTNGILTLAGSNSYSGDTTVLYGTLRLRNGNAIPDSSAVSLANPAAGNTVLLDVVDSETIGTLSGGGNVSGNIAIASSKTLEVNESADSTYAGVISGAGGNVTMHGPGVLTLSGTNTYSGITTITGTLASANPNNLGDGSATNNIASGGGTLRTLGDWTSTRNVAIDSDGFRVETSGFNATLGNAEGSGYLHKRTAGNLTVTHARTGGIVVNAGKLIIAPSSLAAGVSTTGGVFIDPGASLDLKDNKLITGNAPGTTTGGIYNGLQGYVQTAYNFGAWDQPGLTTSMPDAVAGLTTIGIATGEQVRGLGPTDTDTFAGQVISGASTIAMYTYAGDANLDGTIDGGDYGIIDNFVQVPGADGYANGDFNYDGVIDGGDYGIIDNNIQAQGAPFFTSGGAEGAGLSGVTAVPEPSACGLAMLAGAALFGRRRRR